VKQSIKLIKELEEKIRIIKFFKQMNSYYGFSYQVTKLRIKVRTMEKLCSECETGRYKKDGLSIKQLVALRDQTYADLEQITKMREKKPWRTWDRWKIIESHVSIRLVLRQNAWL
jgi:hypothetical protein